MGAVVWSQSIMEEIISRFPVIGDSIFQELNGKDFCMSKEVNRSWNYFMNNERVLKKAYKKRIRDKIDIMTIENDKHEARFTHGWLKTPFHLAAKRGYLPVCQFIIANADDKNPKDDRGMTPLHVAAQYGHLQICELIIANTDDKGPKSDVGYTPLHSAAGRSSSSLQLYQFLYENTDDKNPKSIEGATPFHFAAIYGNLSICQFIVENIDDKNPRCIKGRTPFHKAAWKGHLSICQLIIENTDDKNPKCNVGWTPLHEAAKYGHFSICKLIIENINTKTPNDFLGFGTCIWSPLDVTTDPAIKKLIEGAIIKEPALVEFEDILSNY